MSVSAARTLVLANYLPRHVRGVIVCRQPMWWPPKAADETLDVSIDVAAELAPDGDAFCQVSGQVSPSGAGGARLLDLTVSGCVITAWLTGGAPRTTCAVSLCCLTLVGRVLHLAAYIAVAGPFDEAGAPSAPLLPSVRLFDVAVDSDGCPILDTSGGTLTLAPITWTRNVLTDTNGRTVRDTAGLPILTTA